MTETYWPSDEDTESISTHPAIAKQVFFCARRRDRARIMTCVAGKTLRSPRRATQRERPQKDNRQGSYHHPQGTRPLSELSGAADHDCDVRLHHSPDVAACSIGWKHLIASSAALSGPQLQPAAALTAARIPDDCRPQLSPQTCCILLLVLEKAQSQALPRCHVN